MLNAFLHLSMWLAFTCLILWVSGWWAGASWPFFPYTVAITFGIFAVMVFTAWRRSNG